MNIPNEFGSEVVTPDGRGQIINMHPRGVIVELNDMEFGQELGGLNRGMGGRHRLYKYDEVHIIKGGYCFNERADNYDEQSYNERNNKKM